MSDILQLSTSLTMTVRPLLCVVMPVSDSISLPAGLEINYGESDYATVEGSSVLSSNITLTFRINQNPFSVMFTPVAIDDIDSMDGLGNFIIISNIDPAFRATSGMNFPLLKL